MIQRSGIHCIFKRITFAFAFFSTLASFDLLAVTLYKWVDADGNVSYQSSPPLGGQAFEEKSFSDSKPSSTQATVNGNQLPVSFYISKDCRNCEMVRTILEMNKVPYTQHLTDFNPEIQQDLLAVSGSNKVPAVVIGDQLIKDLDPRSLESALRLSGYPRPALIEE